MHIRELDSSLQEYTQLEQTGLVIRGGLFYIDLKSLWIRIWSYVDHPGPQRSGIIRDINGPSDTHIDIEEGESGSPWCSPDEGVWTFRLIWPWFVDVIVIGRRKLRKYSTAGSRKQIRYFRSESGDYVVSRFCWCSTEYLGIRGLDCPVSTKGCIYRSSMGSG